MAIDLYSGTPGSGKSLRACYKLISTIKSGRNVIGNFPIDENYFKKKKKIGEFIYVSNTDMTVKFLKDYAKEHHKINREHQTLIIIDECASKFNCRNFEAKDRPEWITLLEQHRKLGFDIILITQDDRRIDRQIRSLIETEFKHKAIKNYKTFGAILSLATGGFFVAVEYWYGSKLKCGAEFFRLHKKKARIYDTYKIFE